MTSGKTVKTWSTTRVQGLLRHNRSGRYYARLFSGGKEKWVSLGTTLFEVAKSKMETDETVTDARQGRVDAKRALAGKMTVADAVERYKADLAQRINLKESSRQFWLWNLDSVVRSWPEFNNALVSVNRVFGVAVKAGLIHRNPAKIIERKKEKKKILTLPPKERFVAFVQAIRDMGHRTSADAGDLSELLAYTGVRISEANRLEWEDVFWQKGQIRVKGDPETGTKNWEVRMIPILPDCKRLLEQIAQGRGSEKSRGASREFPTSVNRWPRPLKQWALRSSLTTI
jgi:integrase